MIMTGLLDKTKISQCKSLKWEDISCDDDTPMPKSHGPMSLIIVLIENRYVYFTVEHSQLKNIGISDKA